MFERPAELTLLQRTSEPSITVIIPSYRGGPNLVKLARRLLEGSYRRAEVLVVVDEPSGGLLEELSSIGGCRIIARGWRLGKVSALNTALKLSRGELVVFLDDDVAVEDPEFLRKIAEAMEGYDVGDIKKVVIGQGLLAKLIHVEYVAYNFASKLMAKAAGRSIAVNGAAFAMRKKAVEELGSFSPVVSEDFDIMLRSFRAGHRFTYIDSTYVLNYAPTSWSKWLKQRKRWAIGVALFVRENFRELCGAFAKMPQALIPGLLFSLPSLITSMLVTLLRNQLYGKAAYVVLLSLSSLLEKLVPAAAVITVGLHLTYVVPVLLTAVLLACLHCAAARIIRVKAYVYLYPLYLLVYQPVWFTILMAGFLRVLLFRKTNVEDWVV